jgi:hypothetical protein
MEIMEIHGNRATLHTTRISLVQNYHIFSLHNFVLKKLKFRATLEIIKSKKCDENYEKFNFVKSCINNSDPTTSPESPPFLTPTNLN